MISIWAHGYSAAGGGGASSASAVFALLPAVWRIIGLLAITFAIVGYILLRVLVRNLAPRRGNVQLGGHGAGRRLSRVFGALYLAAGASSVFLGIVMTRDRIPLMVAGLVVCCLGGYLLAVAAKLRAS